MSAANRKSGTYYDRNREARLDYARSKRPEAAENRRNRYAKLKAAIYAILGRSCKRCGFSDSRALQIDHVNGGGWRGTKVRISGLATNKGYGVEYLKAILEDPLIKEKYQILCANCNWIKRYENKEVGRKGSGTEVLASVDTA